MKKALRYDTSQRIVDKYNQLKSVFEELLVQHIVLNELRDYYRVRAGIPTKKDNDNAE